MIGKTARLALRNIRICGTKSINDRMLNAADSDSRKKKQRSQPTVEANRGTEEQKRVESKVGSAYWRFFASQVLASLFTLPFFCTVLWTPTKRTMPDTCATHPIHAAWRLERCEVSYACVVLVINLQVDAIRKSQSFFWW